MAEHVGAGGGKSSFGAGGGRGGAGGRGVVGEGLGGGEENVRLVRWASTGPVRRGLGRGRFEGLRARRGLRTPMPPEFRGKEGGLGRGMAERVVARVRKRSIGAYGASTGPVRRG